MSARTKLQALRRNPRVRADDPEPSIGELLDDSVLQTLMMRDGVARGELLDIIDAARLRLGVVAPFEAILFAECGP